MATSMRGGLPIFTFKGIRVLVHWSFLLLPAYVAYVGWKEGLDLSAILKEIGLVLIVFVCVLLHEFGHSLMAMRYGVRTKNIVLLPIGGVASLERMPEEPRKEFWITLAGPLVNLGIAGIAFLVIAITGLTDFFSDLLLGATEWTNVLTFLFGINISLFLFNLVPAFPMDGGRLLRSLLSMRMARPKATMIAARAGQVLSVGFVVGGFYLSAPFMMLIGVFIFMAAGAEARSVQPMRGTNDASTVRAAMSTRFSSLLVTATVQHAIEELQRNSEELLVVLDENEVRGIVTLELLNTLPPETLLDSVDVTRIPAARPTDDADSVDRYLLTHGYPLCIVVDNGALIGVLTIGGLAAYHAGRKPPPTEDQAPLI